MIKYLIKVFVKNTENMTDVELRTKYSVLAGAIGVVCNIVLFIIKITAGVIMSSIAIISDAFNNLSDTGTSVVSIIGARLSSKKPDKEHPFGHGRLEYISSLIVSFIIMLVGFELLKTSVTQIFVVQPVSLNSAMLVILCISLPVKYWMYSYNKYMGKQINSGVLMAAAKDSINDVCATGAVIFSAVLTRFVDVPWLDGAVGTLVSVVIMYSGFKISMDTIGLLMGTAPKKQTIDDIRNYILSTPGIIGVHDLIVHDYGPGRCLASVHAEVADNCDVVEIHEVIDEVEHRIEKDLGIHIVVHMDPISINCERTAELRNMVKETVKTIDKRMNIHDFRMTDGANLINLIFDIEVPIDMENVEDVKSLVEENIKKIDSRFNTVIDIDYLYD